MINQPTEAEADVARYLRAIKARRGVVAAAAAGGLALAAAYAFLSPSIYQAAALVNVDRIGGDIPQPSDNRRDGLDEEYFQTEVGLITSDSQLKRVYNELRLDELPEFSKGLPALKKAVNAVAVPKTRLAYVYAESRDPRLATAIAGSTARAFVRRNLDQQLFMSKNVVEALQAHERDPKKAAVVESLPEIVNNRVIQDLKTQIYEGQAQLADLRTRYTDGYPAVAALKSKLDALEKLRDQETSSILESLKSQLAGHFRANNARVIDEPSVPTAPVRPRRALALVIGLGVGLALGVLGALLADSVDERVRPRRGIEQKLGLPFLLPIPHASSGPDALEAFRNLRTLVKLADPTPIEPLLLITSASAGEGKSYVAKNLAVALSQSGEKVLVVDGDLRTPSLHVKLNSQAKTGLTDFLSGGVTDPERIAHKTAIQNLDLVPFGSIARNPSELLDARRLADFVAWARSRYARVIVDSSPVFPVSDVLIWGRHVTRSIFVARAGRPRKPAVQTACERLRAARSEIVGGVINDARVRVFAGDGFYFER